MKLGLNRRQFLKQATLGASGAAALLALSGTAQAQAATTEADFAEAPCTHVDGLEADVLVVGAGPSGIPAAIAAARLGARVILLEEDAVIGGAPVDMYVTFLCGGPRRGVHREMVEQLNARHDLSGRPLEGFNVGNDGKDHWYMPAAYVTVLSEMIRREPNLRLLTGAQAIGVRTAEAGNRRRVTGVEILGAGGARHLIKAKVTIDATGTGLIAELAGCQTMFGREGKSDFNEAFGQEKADGKTMPSTLMFISQRLLPGPPLDLSKLKGLGLNESGLGWVKDHPEEHKRRNTGIYLHWGSTVYCQDTRDPVALGQAYQEAFLKAEADRAALAEQGFVVHCAPKIGVRECRRVVGEHVVSLNDLKSGKMPEDVIAVGVYPLDIWGHKGLNKEDKHLPPYGIPYRSLIPKGVEGLLVAGKSISGTHIAMGAYRVQPIVASIGQAAGVAAAMATQKKTSPRNLELAELQGQLRQMGVLENEGKA